MKAFFYKIREIISLIFFEEEGNLSSLRSNDIETSHYQKEIKDLYLDSIHIVTSYREIHALLEAYKYRSEQENGKIFAHLLGSSSLFSQLSTKENIGIVPIPMHWSRYLLRGYSHIDLLVRLLSQETEIPVFFPLKSGFSFRQSKLKKKKRILNRKGIFSLKKGAKVPEEVILVDDIISTGSTANECAKVLKNAGVKKVYGLFLASNRDESILPIHS